MNTINDPLCGFIAEVERGAGLQTMDAAAVRYERMCNEALLDIDKEMPPPPVAIYIGDSPACTFGNFSASIGKPKGKKTFNVSAMTAAAMTNSTILNYRGNMPADQNGIPTSTPSRAPITPSACSSALPSFPARAIRMSRRE